MVYVALDLPEMLSQSLCTTRERYTSPRVSWSIARCGLMKRVKESPQNAGSRRQILRRGEQRILAWKPGYDGP